MPVWQGSEAPSPGEQHHVQHLQSVLPVSHLQVQLAEHPAAVHTVLNQQAGVALPVAPAGTANKKPCARSDLEQQTSTAITDVTRLMCKEQAAS